MLTLKNDRVTVDQFKKVADCITQFNVIAFLHNEDLTAVGYWHVRTPRKSIGLLWPVPTAKCLITINAHDPA